MTIVPVYQPTNYIRLVAATTVIGNPIRKFERAEPDETVPDAGSSRLAQLKSQTISATAILLLIRERTNTDGLRWRSPLLLLHPCRSRAPCMRIGASSSGDG